MEPSDTDHDAISTNPMFAANMAALAEWAPAAHAALTVIKQPHSEIVLLSDEGIDISLRGQSFYGRDAVSFAQEQFDGFAAEPVRWFFNRPNADTLLGTAGKFVQQIEDSLAAEGIDIQPDISDQHAAFALVFGIGLGLHIAPLIEHTQAQTVVLIEPLIENLYHSMFVVDWAALFADAEAHGRQLCFVLAADSEQINASVRNHVRARNPAMLDGVYVYTHYRSSVLDSARQKASTEFFLNIVGLGFFEDELMMLANGSANLNRARVAVIDRQLPARDTAVFIVGSGPSLDRDLPIIKQFRGKAIVISIGTALRVLRANGITPEYHVELENGFGTAYVVSLVKKEFGLDGITLIASVTARPEVVDAFDDALLFFRERVTSTLLYKGQYRVLSPAGPTVANTGLLAAIRLGFRNITMFGVDMGTLDRGIYHSVESIYGLDVMEETDLTSASSSPANFGGTAFAHDIFTWSRQSLEGVLAGHGYVNCRNCSNGALIKGAVPKLSETLCFDGDDLQHDQIKRELQAGMSSFAVAQRQQIWDAANLRKVSQLKARQAVAVFDKAVVQDGRVSDWSQAIYDLVAPDDTSEDDVIRTLMFGTVVMMLGCANWYALRLRGSDQQPVYRRIALKHGQAAFMAMADRTEELLADIEAFCSGARDDIPYIDWSVLTAPELEGKQLTA